MAGGQDRQEVFPSRVMTITPVSTFFNSFNSFNSFKPYMTVVMVW